MARFGGLTRSALWAAALMCLIVGGGRAEAQTGYHYIVGLSPRGDNFLALRNEPSGRYGERIARLGPETLLAPTGERAGRWMAVEVVNTDNAGLYGWVFDGYVACCSGSANPPPPHTVQYGRVVHPRGAPLNMRRGPSLDAPVIGAIPSGASRIPVSDCVYDDDVRSWCQVAYRGENGWVSTRYFELY